MYIKTLGLTFNFKLLELISDVFPVVLVDGDRQVGSSHPPALCLTLELRVSLASRLKQSTIMCDDVVYECPKKHQLSAMCVCIV